MTTTRLCLADGRVVAVFAPPGARDALPPGAGITRNNLLGILWDTAEAAGAEVRYGATVAGVDNDAEQVRGPSPTDAAGPTIWWWAPTSSRDGPRDVAHACTPHLAYGAGIAVEDSVVLAGVLSADEDCLPRALETFMGRRDRACRMVMENAQHLGDGSRTLAQTPAASLRS